MKDLLTCIFGEDYLNYYYDKEQGLRIEEEMLPTYSYNHSLWEEQYHELASQRNNNITQHQLGPVKKKAKKSLFNIKQTDKPRNSSDQDNTSPIKNNPLVQPTLEDNVVLKTKNISHKKVQCPINQSSVTHNLSLCKSTSGASRQQLANISLPRVQPISHIDIKVLNTPIFGTVTDPYKVALRPSKTALDWCNEMISNLRKANKLGDVTGVQFDTIGTFKLNDVNVLQKLCEFENLQKDLLSESQWLNLDDGLPDKDVQQLASVLWDNSPTKVVLKVSLGPNTRAIDVTSLSYLCGERYLDNMVIDVCLSKYMWECNECGLMQTLVLPSSVWAWEKSQYSFFKEQVKRTVDDCKSAITNIQQIIIPLYMPSHWGIVYISLQCGRIYFDDGMKFPVPKGLLIEL